MRVQVLLFVIFSKGIGAISSTYATELGISDNYIIQKWDITLFIYHDRNLLLFSVDLHTQLQVIIVFLLNTMKLYFSEIGEVSLFI